MPITTLMVLPPDVLVTPVARLTATVRERLGSPRGGYVITRPGTRAPSRLLDRQAAKLLERFRAPTRIVDAVRAFSLAHRLDPAATLADAFPVLSDCMDQQLLVDAGSPAARRIEATLARGDRIGAFTIVQPVQVLQDTELYQAAGPSGAAAVKICRPGAASAVRRQIRREVAVLRRLRDTPTPELLGTGVFEDRPWLALAWCPGVSPLTAAAELRGDAGTAGRERVLALCCAVADAYARLHARGVVHGDVHPGNLLVDHRGQITLLDFGLARFTRGTAARTLPRGGVAYYLSPEYAAAWVRRRPPPAPTPRSEQYAVAALLFRLAAGEHYLDLPMNRRAAHQQIVSTPPLPFTRLGAAPWPALETILARALHKDPARRFASMKALGAALRSMPTGRRAAPARARRVTTSAADRLLDQTLATLGATRRLPGRELPNAPLSSLQLGGGGIAYALYRIACIRDNPGLLQLADAWLARAERDALGPAGFTNVEQGVTADTVGRISLWHGAPGVHLVRALISQATGDLAEMGAATGRFIAASEQPCDNLDLTLGRSGTLLGCALLLEALPGGLEATSTALRRLAAVTGRAVGRAAAAGAAVGEGARSDLHAAHGWAGLLFAMLRWSRASGTEPPPWVRTRLDELADCGEPDGRGMRWRSGDREAVAPRYLPSWCNGSAGLVLLWSLAERTLRDARFLTLTERAAWHAWESPHDDADLCCGRTGRAYAMLSAYRATGAPAWLDRARTLADAAAKHPERFRRTYRLSLTKGHSGLAVLAADLSRPGDACMPLLEEEGWPSSARESSDD